MYVAKTCFISSLAYKRSLSVSNFQMFSLVVVLVLVFNCYSSRAREVRPLKVGSLETQLRMKDESPALGRSAGSLSFAVLQPRGLSLHFWFHLPLLHFHLYVPMAQRRCSEMFVD